MEPGVDGLNNNPMVMDIYIIHFIGDSQYASEGETEAQNVEEYHPH